MLRHSGSCAFSYHFLCKRFANRFRRWCNTALRGAVAGCSQQNEAAAAALKLRHSAPPFQPRPADEETAALRRLVHQSQ